MKIIAMMSFFEDEHDLVYDALSSVADIADAVVALDGAYELFPTKHTRSPSGLIQMIASVCGVSDLGLLLFQPGYKFAGNEVAKRQMMIDLALSITTDDDWLLVLDTDYRVLKAPEDLKSYLAQTEHDSALCSFLEHHDPESGEPQDCGVYIRALYKADRQLRMLGTNHYTYVNSNGIRQLNYPINPDQPAADLRGELIIEHRYRERDPERRARQTKYYEGRDTKGVET